MGLFSLHRRQDPFFELLEARAKEGLVAAQSLSELVHGSRNESVQALIASTGEQTGKERTIETLLCQSYTTPLDKEDIERLARALYRIPKGLKKFAGRYILCQGQLEGVDFRRQVEMLETATRTVYEMVADFKTGANMSATKSRSDLLHKLEGEADEQLALSLDELYRGKHEPLQAIMLKDLYEGLEKVFDRCRTAGNLILEIVLKHT